jgi:hypothetical protein
LNEFERRLQAGWFALGSGGLKDEDADQEQRQPAKHGGRQAACGKGR